MKKLSNKDYQLLEQICRLKQATLWKTMYEYLKTQYKRVKKTRDYIYAEGDIPVVLLAHLDTVFAAPPDHIYYDERKGVLWSPDGLGADDRAGVFAILKIIGRGYKPHIIFTTDEEKGGVGATQLALNERKCPFENVKYMIQLDRRGKTDCVFYDCDNEKFTKYVESFGFIEEIGSFSDISILSPAWKIAGVNLSIGYEDEHSISETLHVNPLFTTIKKVGIMLDQAAEAPYFEFIPSKWYEKYYNSKLGFGFGSTYDFLAEYGDDTSMENYLTDAVICDVCERTFSEYEVIPVEQKDHSIKYICPDCLSSSNADWCYSCGEAYNPGGLKNDDHLCYTCRVEYYLDKNKVRYERRNKDKGKKCS